MLEQEQYMKLMKKMLDETYNDKIKTADQFIQKITSELTKNHLISHKQSSA